MCGIAGIAANSNENGADLRASVSRMCHVIRARGPDDEGVFVAGDNSVAFGNRRLAIRDISPAGHMPMSNPEQTVWITYNGEIYNADELRAELVGLGCQFRSNSDTEVILHGYAEWGRTVVDRLRGMFALAVYDKRPGAPARLLLARDQLGIKPLYYTWRRGVLGFASECRALRAACLSEGRVDEQALLMYFRLGSVPAPATIYSDIRALEAGSTIEAVREAGAWRLQEPTAAWRPPTAVGSGGVQRPWQELVEEVRELLVDSVRRHLVSDVPLGAFLSGGLDSGTIVAMMREVKPGGVIRTCSVGFREATYDESALASDVAERFETEHVQIVIGADDLARDLDRIIASLDQPTNDGINTYMVSKAAHGASLTVALSGLGGDELFGGYPSFSRLGPIARASSLSSRVPRGTRMLGRALQMAGDHRPTSRLGGWLGHVSHGSRGAVYLGLRGLFSQRELASLVSSDVLERDMTAADLVRLVDRSAGDVERASAWEAASRYELTCYMRHQLLRDTDVMSMAHSLEVRVPFVDRAVVERVLRLPLRTPPGGLSKQILRDASRTLPESVRNRSEKRGFTFPFQLWLSGPLRPRLEELMRSAEAQLMGYLQPGCTDYLLDAFDAGQIHWSRPWALAALCSVFATPERDDSQLDRGSLHVPASDPVI